MGVNSGFGISDAMFSIMPVFIGIMFVLVFGAIIVSMVKGIGQWQKNNESPILDVDATVVTKRSDVSMHHHNTAVGDDNHMTHSSSTYYYVTFEVSSGDRMEFAVRDTEYGLLVEGDRGKLKFQGTRYLGFERNTKAKEEL